MIAGDEHALLQFAIEQAEKFEHARPVGLAPFGHLRFHVLHGRMQMAKDRRHRLVEIELHAPVPHLHQRLLGGAAPEQRRLRTQSLEIAADRD